MLLVAAGCGDVSAPAGPLPPPTLPITGPGSCATASYRADQGQKLQGTTGTGFTIQSVSLGCGGVSDLHVEGAELVATRNGTVVRGGDFLGGTLALADSQGNVALAAVGGVDPDPMDASGQTFLYTLLYTDPMTGAVVNACLPDPSGVAKALPLLGVWDATGAKHDDGVTISLACTSGVLAKCVRWGYHPWETVDGVSLSDYHQACSRMARADYCGDGQTHTMNGTPIDMYDALHLLPRAPGLPYIFEATWTTSGAYCIARERWITLAGLLPDACLQTFTLAIEASPIDSTDLCLEKRLGAVAKDALLSDSTGVNLGL